MKKVQSVLSIEVQDFEQVGSSGCVFFSSGDPWSLHRSCGI